MSALWQKLTAGASGVTSVCSGHQLVVEATFRQAALEGTTVLIEATCNQVNHRGGYTGLAPADFKELVHRVADDAGFPWDRVVLGGDHLGPSPWRHLPADEAMSEAEQMVRAYVAAGYEKIHLDTSMGCQGEPVALGDELTAARAARLALVAEQTAAQVGSLPSYVVGTEVPTPGGALHEIHGLQVTTPEAVKATLDAHESAFAAVGAAGAFERAMAVVTQPGVEFDNQNVVVYEPERARQLSTALSRAPGLVYEAHSTDYQPPAALGQLVRDGFGILKVGPGLTFALREAFYALDHMATFVGAGKGRRSLVQAMEDEMLANPGYWDKYYFGTPAQQRLLRHFSYSDRLRYYWASPGAQKAVQELFDELDGTTIPETLVSQYLPTMYARVAAGTLAPTARQLALQAVQDVLHTYATACRTPRG